MSLSKTDLIKVIEEKLLDGPITINIEKVNVEKLITDQLK